MTLMSASLAHHISTMHGVVTTAQLIDDGYTEHTIKRQVELGVLVSSSTTASGHSCVSTRCGSSTGR